MDRYNYKKVWDFLGSRDLSVFIFVMGCTYALMLVIFGFFIPVPWVGRIATLLPFKVLYLMFFINLIICEIKWIPVVIRRCNKPKLPETAEELQRFRHRIEVSSQESGIGLLEKHLRRRGYKIQVSVVSGQGTEENTSRLTSHFSPILYAYKGRFSPIGNLLFHAAFLFLLLGGWVSTFNSFEGTTSLVEEQGFMGSKEEYSGISSKDGDIPVVSFEVARVVPEFWEKQFLFTDLRAELRYLYNGKVRSGIIRLSQPLKINGANVTIAGIGYVPMYLLKDKEGNELDKGYVKMNIFPPGTMDHFQIPGYPHQIFVSFYPDYEIKEGRIANRSMKPVNPAYFIRVFRNKVLSYQGIVKQGEDAYFEGLNLSFPEFKYWGQFKIVKNPGFIYIWTAFVLFGLGLVWRLLFYKKEVAVVKEDEVLLIYDNSDYYHRLFEDRLRMFAEKGE